MKIKKENKDKMNNKKIWLYYFLINYGVLFTTIIYLCLGFFLTFQDRSPNIKVIMFLTIIYVLVVLFLRKIMVKGNIYCEYLLTSKIELDNVEGYGKQVVNSTLFNRFVLKVKQHRYNNNIHTLNLNAYSCLISVYYYKGNFEEAIKVAEKIDFSTLQIYESNQVVFQVVQYAFALRSNLLSKDMVKSGILFEQLEQLVDKYPSQSQVINTVLQLSQAIKDIVCDGQVNDFVDEWQPKTRLLKLEKLYFQALNEELKGSVAQARQYFVTLSRENRDLFFVKTAKLYLEENQ